MAELATGPNDMYAGIPSIDEINRRLIENAREKRLLQRMKKMAEQRDWMRETSCEKAEEK